MDAVHSEKRSWVEQIMGMPISVLARGAGARDESGDEAVQTVFAELRDVDETFSTYKELSEISRIASGKLSLDEASVEDQEVARKCVEAQALTDGLFNAQRPDGIWDPSGLVKGWAAERAFRLLLQVEELDWCLNAGGDVIVSSASGEAFNVGIQDPADPARLSAVIRLTKGAVATSGTAARGEHLYDPRDGCPISTSRSVSVSGPSLELADVLATAAFIAGDDGLALVERFPAYEAMRIDTSGAVTSTPGW